MVILLKKLFSCLIAIIFLLVPNINAAAYNETLDFSLDIPAENQTGKTTHASIYLCADGNCSLGAVMFSVIFDPSFLEVKDVYLKNGINGEASYDIQSNELKILYLNTGGYGLNSSQAEFIEVKFKAQSNVGETNLYLFANQGATANEEPLSVQNGLEYIISLQDKEVTNSSSASGSRVSSNSASSVKNKNTSSGSTSSKANKNDSKNSKPNENENQAEDSIVKPSNNNMQLGYVGSWFEENLPLFLFGTAFAIGIVLVVFCLYKFKKKALTTNLTENAENIIEENTDKINNKSNPK